MELNGSLRSATPEDLDSVLELDRAAPVGRERSEYLTARVHAGEVTVFERDGHLLGYAVRRPTSFFGRDFVDLLAVAVNSRRQGVGSALLERAVHSSSTSRIFTSTNRSNAGMTELLTKAGWGFSGELEGIDDGDPELVFYRDAH
jgi:GNAT superfamily N-acetyltransferase